MNCGEREGSVYIRFRVLEKLLLFFFFFLVRFKKVFFFGLCFFFFNIVLMWKIVKASKVSVLYIYIYRLVTLVQVKNKLVLFFFHM